MIKISKASKKEALDRDWQKIIDKNYGQGLPWFERGLNRFGRSCRREAEDLIIDR